MLLPNLHCVSGSPGGGVTRRDSDPASLGWALVFFSKLLKTGVGYDIDWLWLISVEAGRWVLRGSLYSLFTFEVLPVYS